MAEFRSVKIRPGWPVEYEIGPMQLRHATQQSIGADGDLLTAQGRASRTITQRGQFVADDLDQLDEYRSAWEALVDGVAGDLVDDVGRTWTPVVMTSLTPKLPQRLGPRWVQAYVATYVQLQP